MLYTELALLFVNAHAYSMIIAENISMTGSCISVTARVDIFVLLLCSSSNVLRLTL